MALTSIFPTVAEVVPSEQPSTENAAVPAEKSSDEQASTKEEVVKPSEAYAYRAPNAL